MRCEYAATGREPFAVLRAAAYGLRRPTADEIYCDDCLVSRPRRKTLPTGDGRDERLTAIAEQLLAKAGAERGLHTWRLCGHFYFDYSPREARWLLHYALPHARSFGVRLSIPAFEEWMADGGEEKIVRFEERERRRARPVRLPRNDSRPLRISTRVRRRPDLDMLTRGQYPERYCPRTDAEEMRGVLVAQTQGAYIAIGRGFEPPRHGHKAFLRVDGRFWMSTSPKERLMVAQDARRCPPGADAFVGGLGLGLIVLYLARRCRCITVAEIDERVIRLVWPRLVDYLQPRYPDLELRIFLADALDVVRREPGRYDFVYILYLWVVL